MDTRKPGSSAAGRITIKALRTKFHLPILLMASLIVVSMRLNDFSYIEQSLWYEDGLIYISQASELGLRSLWSALGGYQIIYNRIVAIIASHFSLVATPYIYSFAWLVAFFSIGWVITLRGRSLGVDGLLAAFLACAIALQPNHGEPFFNLNHAYFFLGIALSLYVCIPVKKSPSLYEATFLLAAGLSGPFSAILLPTAVLQLAILRDFSERRSMYVILLATGLVQCFYIVTWRFGMITLDSDPARWLHAVSGFVFFGKSDKLSRLSSVVFWVLTVVYLIKWINHRKADSDLAAWLSPPLAAITAIGMFLISVWSSASYLPTLGPLDMGARYFLVPYSLMFAVAITCTREHRSAQTAVVATISVICATSLLAVDREDRASSTGLLSHVNMQWTAFAKFNKVKPGLLIPINASLPMYPPVHARVQNPAIGGKKADSLNANDFIPIQPELVMAPFSSPAPVNGKATIKSSEQSATFYFDIRSYCTSNPYVAVEIDIWRSRMGWATIYWGQLGRFDSERSLKRFYPKGATLMQFAFRKGPSDVFIKLDAAEGVTDSPALRTVNAFFKDQPGTIVAEPTAPGGDLKINSARLYCLN